MPEGDTIHRTAARLANAIEGVAVTVVDLPRWAGRSPEPGEVVTSIDALGKHLLMSFSGGLVLHTHMKMTGSWHLHRAGEPWRRARSRARAVISTEVWEAVCFDAPIVEFTTPFRLRGQLAHLGPDLTRGATADVIERCVQRMGQFLGAGTELADALRDQRVCCGVGNVYASEVCWFAGLDPAVPLGEVPLARRHSIVDRASQLLAANLEGGRRATVAGGLAVYGRAGESCRRCGGTIRSAHQGVHARITYWCPGCQLGVARG